MTIYEMKVKLSAEKNIRFNTEEGETAEEKAQKIIEKLNSKDFHKCDEVYEMKQLKEVTE